MIALAAAALAQPAPVDEAADPVEPAVRVALERDGTLWVSADAGETWQIALPAPRRRAPELDRADPDLPDPHLVEDGELAPDQYDALVRRAVDDARRDQTRAIEGARHESERGSGVQRTWFDGDRLWVVRQDGGHWSADRGQTWTDESPPVIPARAEVEPVDAGGGAPLDRIVAATLAESRSPRVRAPAIARDLPSLVVTVERYTRVVQGFDAWLAQDGGSVSWFGAGLQLEWGLGRGAAAAPDLDLVQVDGRWILDDGSADPLLARAITRHGAHWQGDRVEEAIRLCAARAALLRAPATGSLADRVETALDLQEVEARLEGLTGGRSAE